METTDEDVLRLAKALAVDVDAVLLGGVSSEERMKLLERACSMRDSLDLLIKELSNSARTGDDHAFSTTDPVGIESIVRVDTLQSYTTPAMQLGISNTRQTRCCEHVCSYMNHALWSTLPVELLQMVFASLPYPQMCQHLRLLSKHWKWSVREGSSALIRALREANPKMLAIVYNTCEGSLGSLFSGTFLYDFKANVWHFFRLRFEIDLASYNEYYAKCGSGGLVCYVKAYWPTIEIPSILVCNPLTRECKALPPHSLSHLVPSMVQLVVDRDTRCYQVIWVLHRNGDIPFGELDNVAMVYDSATGAWSSSSNSLSSCIFGYRVRLHRVLHEGGDRLLGICAFDGARDEFLDLDAFIEPSESCLDSCRIDANHAIPGYALMGDHLFVLHEELQSREPHIRILEYQAQTCKPNWVKRRTHECYPLDQCLIGTLEGRDLNWKELYTLRLDACEGSLMVTTKNKEYIATGLASGYKHERAWLYDLCTREWKEIAALEGFSSNGCDPIMCELRWDAVP